MALSLVKIAAKFGIAGGAIYYSVQQGVWGTVDEGTNAMIKMTAALDPAIIQKSKEVESTMPSSEVLNTSLAGYWNTGVKTIFEQGAQIPELTQNYTEKASDAVSNLLKQQ